MSDVAPDPHRIVAVTVLLECACGDLFEGDTENQAMRDYEIHASDEGGVPPAVSC